MKKTTWLIATLIMPVLCFAQEPTPSPTPSEAHLFLQRLTNATTLAQVADLETEFASKLDQWTPISRSSLITWLRNAYVRVSPGGFWQFDVIPKYDANWTAGGSLALYYHNRVIASIPYTLLRSGVRNAATIQQLDSLVEAYFATNVFPENIDGDNRSYSVTALLLAVAEKAVALGHPQAVNWALQSYRNTSIRASRHVDNTVQAVAKALKAKDFNLIRANAWIESQNTGEPGVVFTPEELALPTALAPVADKPWIIAGTQAQLDIAKQDYRDSSTSVRIDVAIIDIANVLKAKDLNLARANAWIEAQKTGQAFDLKLE